MYFAKAYSSVFSQHTLRLSETKTEENKYNHVQRNQQYKKSAILQLSTFYHFPHASEAIIPFHFDKLQLHTGARGDYYTSAVIRYYAEVKQPPPTT